MKKLIITGLALWLTVPVFAQRESGNQAVKNLHITAAFQTNHLWRGLIVTDQPLITGEIWYDLNKADNLHLGFWGSSSFSNDDDGTHYQEINYFIYYEDKGLFLGLWDLYNSRAIDSIHASSNIFDYSRKRTNHLLDLRTAYRFQGDIPLRVELDVILYGGANAGEVVVNKRGEYVGNRHSTYFELSYPFIDKNDVKLDGFVGAGFPLSSQNGSGQLYGEGSNNFDIVNVGFIAEKKFNISGLEVPFTFKTIWNPNLGYARVQIAVNFLLLNPKPGKKEFLPYEPQISKK